MPGPRKISVKVQTAVSVDFERTTSALLRTRMVGVALVSVEHGDLINGTMNSR